MAIYHASIKAFSRGRGHSSTAAAAYRAGIAICDEKTDTRHDYTRRKGVASVDMLAPKGAPAWALDPAACFNKSEQAETRANARVARELEVALPAELDEQQRRDLARDLAQLLVDRYQVAVLVAVHTPDKGGDERNHHAHLLMTPRQVGHEGLGARACAEFDARQGVGPASIRALREAVADRINLHLERAQLADRVDHRNLVEQAEAAGARGHIGLAVTFARESTHHEGKAVTAMRRRGEHSDRAATNNSIRITNQNDLREYLRLLEHQGRLLEAPERHSYETARHELAAGSPAEVLNDARSSEPRDPLPGQGSLLRARAPVGAVAQASRRGVCAGRAATARGASRFPPSLKAALARASRRLRTRTGNRQADEAMARCDEEMAHLESEARRAWLEGIDQALRQSQAAVTELLVPRCRGGRYAHRAAYRGDMRELLKAVKQAARDSTRWERRLKAEADAGIKLSEAKRELTTWEAENPKPSAWRGSRREWVQRRGEYVQRVWRRRARRDQAREATGPGPQVKYTKAAADGLLSLEKLARSMLQRYPIDADELTGGPLTKPTRVETLESQAMSEDATPRLEEQKLGPKALNGPKSGGPSV